MKKHLTLLISLVVATSICFAGNLFAEDMTQAPAEEIASAEVSLTGAVEKTDTGIVIKVADTDYIVAGENLEPMAGKTVKVTGTLSEGESGKTINVMSFEEIAQQ